MIRPNLSDIKVSLPDGLYRVAVGLGNIWRFPYVAGESGGGAFVLLHCFLLGIGIPIVIAELLIGKKGRAGSVGSMRAEERVFLPFGSHRLLKSSCCSFSSAYAVIVDGSCFISPEL